MFNKRRYLILAILLFSTQSYAERVLIVNEAYQANTNAYVVHNKYEANCLVYQVDQEYKANKAGWWYMVHEPNKADLKVFYVDQPSNAKLKVFFVNNDYEAKC